MNESLLNSLAVVMAVAGVVTVFFHFIRQPVVLGYILAGLIIGPYTPQFPLVVNDESIKALSDLGVVFLLFSLGLEFNLRKLARVGLGAGLAAAMEISLMVWIGYHVGRMFGWDTMNSLFLGAMISISSSTVMFKTLHQMGRAQEPFAEFMFGVLVFEDILAVAMLGLLSGVAMTHTVDVVGVLGTLGRLGVFLAFTLVAGLLVVPPLIRFVRRFQSSEMLLITVLGVCFGMSLFALKTGFSVALGAFVAGAIMAEARETRRIIAVVEPVRDLFSAIFFVAIGMLIDPSVIFDHALPIAVITLCVLIGKSSACTLGALLAGNTPRTAIHAGLGMSQIGEFSYIIAALGLSLGVTDKFLYPIAVCVSSITIFTTPILLGRGDKLAGLLERHAPPPLVTAIMAYGQWVSTLRTRTPANAVVYAILRRSLLQMFINMLLGSGLFITAAAVAAHFGPRDGWWSHLPSWTGGLKTLCWFTAVVVAIPLLIAIFRKIQAVGMILAEMATPANVSRPQVLTFRAIVSNVILTTGSFMVCFWLLMVSTLVLPPWPMLSFLGGVALLLGVALRGPSVRIYARGQIMLREMFAQPLDPPGSQREESAKPLPSLLRKAELDMVSLGQQAPSIGRPIRELDIRAKSGASVVGIERAGQSVVNPSPDERLQAGDNVLLLGSEEQLRAGRQLLCGAGQ